MAEPPRLLQVAGDEQHHRPGVVVPRRVRRPRRAVAEGLQRRRLAACGAADPVSVQNEYRELRRAAGADATESSRCGRWTAGRAAAVAGCFAAADGVRPHRRGEPGARRSRSGRRARGPRRRRRRPRRSARGTREGGVERDPRTEPIRRSAARSSYESWPSSRLRRARRTGTLAPPAELARGERRVEHASLQLAEPRRRELRGRASTPLASWIAS